MKLCVTSSGRSLEDTVDSRFGRSPYLIIVDSETMRYEVIENPAMAASTGAGIQAAQLVSDKGAEVMLTGNVGPNALDTLEAAGLKTVTGLDEIMVRQAVEQFNAGHYRYASNPSVESKPPGGSETARGMGRGSGGSRGAGRGMGRGRGLGKGHIRAKAGPVGKCICPSCGTDMEHQLRVPCSQVECPQCGTKMVKK